jgi:hypothetical protein
MLLEGFLIIVVGSPPGYSAQPRLTRQLLIDVVCACRVLQIRRLSQRCSARGVQVVKGVFVVANETRVCKGNYRFQLFLAAFM